MAASTPKAREGAWLWLVKIIAGVLILVVLGVHFVMNHMVAPGGLLTYADVVRYYQIPYVVAMEIIFLVTVVTHSFIGLRSILLDLNPSEPILKAATALLSVAGVAAVAYGAWLIFTIAGRG